MHLNPLAIAVAVVAAFILSSTYYAVFARRMASLHPAYVTTSKTPAWKPLLELVRNVVTDKARGVFYVETFPWADAEAAGRAHSLPEVAAVWEPMGECCTEMEFPSVERVEV